MSMAGYVLSRSDFKYRNAISFFIYFTTLFSGGLVPSYILMVNYLGLKDNILAMILPGMVSAWSIFLMRNFMKAIPDSLYESAAIDGAGDFRIYWQIFIPLAGPSLATIGLFLALGYWNEWYNAMLYIQSQIKFPLQFFLQKIVTQANVQLLIQQGAVVNTSDLPSESIKMATAVVAIGPIILLYPFVQKYFVSGLTIGAVKG
jgi:putative aldouronate transport system permease protein